MYNYLVDFQMFYGNILTIGEIMDFNEYQEKARSTAIYPDIGNNLVYTVLGLAGEAGEVSEKLKKVIRDDGGKVSEKKREEFKKEAGDVLWYLANIAAELNTTLEEIAEKNIEKLFSRKARGVLQGSGDNR